MSAKKCSSRKEQKNHLFKKLSYYTIFLGRRFDTVPDLPTKLRAEREQALRKSLPDLRKSKK